MLSDTELKLSFWRDGFTKSERLAAALLRLSGYEEIDPQSPLGGPDGKKDILCQKGGFTWVGAVYFPTGPTRFATIKKKFQSDLAGAPSRPEGFVFVTNQTLTPSHRSQLSLLARAAGKEVDILHLQRVLNLLNDTSGYGIRLEYLKIPMTNEEQLSWAAASDRQTAKALTANTREILALRAAIDRMNVDQSKIIRTLGVALPADAIASDLISVSSFSKDDDFSAISADINLSIMLLFHRLVCFELPSRTVGKFRTDQVWLGDKSGRMATHAQPPDAAEIEGLLKSLCDDWNQKYRSLRGESAKLSAVSEFHSRFLLIHPFFDGNGRTGRAILMQQCLDLFGRADMALMNKGAEYYAALKSADAKDYLPLISIILPIVRG